jgi:hypothetical protein
MKPKNVRVFQQFAIGGMLLFSSIALLCFGLLGVGRNHFGDFADGRVFYAAGRAWLQGRNPYDYAQLATSVADMGLDLDNLPFFYPPNSAALLIPMAFFPVAIGKMIWIGFNLTAIALIVFVTVKLIQRAVPGEKGILASGIMAAIIIGNPFTSHVVWMGQTSLTAFAGVMGVWYFSQQQRWGLTGVCLAIASYKPQLCLLIVLWYLLERNWRVLLTALGTASLMALYPMMVQGGPINLLVAWKKSLTLDYRTLNSNFLGFDHKIGLQSLFEAAGITIPNLMLIAIGLTVLLWLFRHQFNQEAILPILLGITLTFTSYCHDYDYVYVFPILTIFCIYICHNISPIWSVIPLVGLLFLPQRLFRAFEITALNHWRTLVVLAMLFLLTTVTYRRQPPAMTADAT